MHTFIDGENRKWNVVINVGSVIRVRDMTGVDLLQPESQKDGVYVAIRLVNDPVFLTEVTAALLKPALDKAGITAESFADSMTGEAIAAAEEAVTKELRLFFAASGRTDRSRLIDRARSEIRKQAERAATETDLSGAQSGVAPESPESTPAPSRSPN